MHQHVGPLHSVDSWFAKNDRASLRQVTCRRTALLARFTLVAAEN